MTDTRMENSCIRQTALPNTSKLFADFTYRPDLVAPFYPYLPLESDSFRKAAAQIHFSDEQRAQLIAALSIQNAGNPLLQKLAQPGTVAVVTGQQVGLFSGPPYTIYKALTAIRLADELTAQGIPAVPIFWLATEDHDFEEVNHAWVFDAQRRAVKLTAAAAPGSNQPVGGVVIEQSPLAELRAALDGLPFAEQACAMAEAAYRPGVTFGQAFATLLDRLLTGFPILRVDPLLPAFRTLASPVIREAVLRAPELTDAVLERNRALAEAGYHAQVHVEPSTSFFFLIENGQRLALRRHDGNYFAGTVKHSAEELAANACNLSPNALLRPVVQDSMIPTIAYVGGPAELAYLAQSEQIYRLLLGRQPIAVHRASFTVMGPHDRKLLDRYHLDLPDFFQGAEAVRERAARVLVDPMLMSSIAGARQSAEAALGRMASGIQRFDQSIAKALETSRRKIEYQFSKMERKVGREALARDERATQDVAALTGLLFPHNKLQERFYSGLSLIAQYGPDFVPGVYQHLTMDCPDHQVLTLA